MSAPILDLQNISVSYGGIQAVRGINLRVMPGELVTLIGANGAGKSTTLRAITGLVHPAGGKVFYEGKDITNAPPYALVERGLVMVPEGRGIFGQLTIEENLAMGAFVRNDKAAIAQEIETVFGIFPRLKERRKQSAGTLSGGEQQMLAIGRAMLSKPKLLLLDEPSMGLAPLMVAKIFETVRMISKQGTTVLLIEQNAKLALKAANRAYVMESGVITIDGRASDLLNDPKVKAAYLGDESH
jgi:branched-chain amino acid transport system ATP-binding protein